MHTSRKNNDSKDENIEIRSPKVRQLLGEIPPHIAGWGLVIISIVIIALILTVCLMPYPYSDGEPILHHLLH